MDAEGRPVCSGYGIWDPPIRLDTVGALAPIIVTAHDGIGAHATASALPELLLMMEHTPRLRRSATTVMV